MFCAFRPNAAMLMVIFAFLDGKLFVNGNVNVDFRRMDTKELECGERVMHIYTKVPQCSSRLICFLAHSISTAAWMKDLQRQIPGEEGSGNALKRTSHVHFPSA